MRSSSHEHRDLQLPRQHQQAVNVVGMLVRNQNCGKRMRIGSRSLHALESLAAGNSRVHENPRRRPLHNRAVSPAAASQHRDRDCHARSILPCAVETEVTFWLAGTFEQNTRLSVFLSSHSALSNRRSAIRVIQFGDSALSCKWSCKSTAFATKKKPTNWRLDLKGCGFQPRRDHALNEYGTAGSRALSKTPAPPGIFCSPFSPRALG